MARPSSMRVPVIVQGRSSRNEIVGIIDGRVKIRTMAAPENGRANQQVVRQLADVFDVAAIQRDPKIRRDQPFEAVQRQ